MYQNYIFDLYGTLIDVELDMTKEDVWRKLSLFYGFYGVNYTAESIKEKFDKFYNQLMELNADSDYYEPDFEEIFYRLFKKKSAKLKKRIPKEAARLCHILAIEKMTLYKETIVTLKALQDQKKRLFLLSNAQRCFTKDDLNYFGLAEYFEEIYLSSDYAEKKPSKKLFKQVIKDYKLDLSKTLMVGNDHANDIEGARAVGLDTCYFNLTGKSDRQQAKYEILNGKLSDVLTF